MLSAAFCAFDFSPLRLPLAQTLDAAGALANLLRDQPTLSESLLKGDRATGACLCARYLSFCSSACSKRLIGCCSPEERRMGSGTHDVQLP